MSDEPQSETAEPKKDESISKTKNLKLQPSAEFVAEQEATTGPQISLPSSPAPAATAAPAPAPQEPTPATPTPAAPSYTPAPDPLAQQMQAQATPVEAPPAPEAPPAQPVVPAAFQVPAQAAAASGKPEHAQQFTLTSEVAAAEREATAMTSLLDGGAITAGLLSTLVFVPGGYWLRNTWVIFGVALILVGVGITCAAMRYRARGNLGVVSTVGVAASTIGLVTILQYFVVDIIFRNYGIPSGLF